MSGTTADVRCALVQHLESVVITRAAKSVMKNSMHWSIYSMRGHRTAAVCQHMPVSSTLPTFLMLFHTITWSTATFSKLPPAQPVQPLTHVRIGAKHSVGRTQSRPL